MILRQVIGSELLRSCREYYGALGDQGFAQYGGNAGEPHRWVLYNDPLARLLHRTIGRFAGLAVPEPLTPSFAYFLKYLEGASLARHRDREQCAVTAVLQVDFDPARPGPTPWPLMFVRDGQTIAVTLAPGDIVVFRGTEIEHYREPLACGRSSTNLAFCFVPAGLAGSLA